MEAESKELLKIASEAYNHIEILCEALADFSGTSRLLSHSREFNDRLLDVLAKFHSESGAND